MARIGSIAPIDKQYGNQINTIDQQLAKNGLHRAPGTFEMLLPYQEMSGRYRTGLDVDAPYLDRLSEEDRKAEKERITKDKQRLEKMIGVPGILDSTSIFYKFGASIEQLRAKHGTDLQVVPVKLSEGVKIFDDEDILSEITWNWIKVHPRIAPSLDAYRNGKTSQDLKYYVVDDKAEAKETYNRRKELNQATMDFENLSPDKRKQVGRLMGLPISDSTDEMTVYNLVDAEIKKPEFTSGKHKGSSPIRLFNELVKMTNDRIKVKDLVEQALLHNIYRQGQGGKITEGGVTIALSEQELIENLIDVKGQLDLLALEKKLTTKKIEKL